MVPADTTPVLLAQLLSQVERRVARRVERVLDADGVNLEQWRVLSLLADGRGHPMSEIAGYAMVPAPTLTKIIDRMVERNLVYRRLDDADRRRVLVFLARRGRDLYRTLIAKVQREEQAILQQVGESDRTQFQQLLTRMLDHIP
ncbi:MAG: MarR family transcriptional regulator [Pseudonocardiaceae bacterium]|nr:MarR family transcriptional regulator [Pseudonocardiaceae bacterium]